MSNPLPNPLREARGADGPSGGSKPDGASQDHWIADYAAELRLLVDTMPKHRIGTLDRDEVLSRALETVWTRASKDPELQRRLGVPAVRTAFFIGVIRNVSRNLQRGPKFQQNELCEDESLSWLPPDDDSASRIDELRHLAKGSSDALLALEIALGNVDLKDAAERLGMSLRTVQRAFARGLHQLGEILKTEEQ